VLVQLKNSPDSPISPISFFVSHLCNTKNSSGQSHCGQSQCDIVPTSLLRFDKCGIDFKESPLVLLDSEGSTSLEVRLRHEPNCSVTVNMISDLPIAPCVLFYNSSNWDQFQTVQVFSDPETAIGSGDVFGTIEARAEQEDCYYRGNETSDITRTIASSAWATSWDGTRFDYYYEGDHYLVRKLNSEFVIQTRQLKCRTVSCNYGVAVKYRSAVFYVYLSERGTPSTFSSGDLPGNGMAVSYSNGKYVVTVDGAITSIRPSYWKGGDIYYLNVEVLASGSLFGQVRGLAGDFDGNSANDLQDPSGTPQVNLLNFQQSWLVPDSENLFLDPAASIPELSGSSGSSPPSISAPQKCDQATNDITDKLVSESSNQDLPQQMSNTTGIFDPDFEPSHDGTFENAEKESEANETCRNLFLDGPLASKCNLLGVDGLPYYEECMFDYSLTGDDSFVQSAIDSYTAKCKEAGATAGEDPSEDSVLSCPGFCSNQGDCINGTCNCFTGYSGDDCSVDLNQPPVAFDPEVSPTPGCQDDLNIQGDHFTGTSVSCKFTSAEISSPVTTPATVYTKWSLSCPIPSLGIVSGMVSVTVIRDSLESSPVEFAYHKNYSNPCQNFGVCVEGSDSFACNCKTGTTGDLCETLTEQPPAQCFSLGLDSFCFDHETNLSTYCYTVQIGNHALCTRNTIEVVTDCGDSLIPAEDTSATFMGVEWSQSLEPGSSHQLCFSMKGLINLKNFPRADPDQNSPGGVLAPYCEVDVCDPNPCQNGGACLQGDIGLYVCECPLGFVGEHCETNVDDCPGNGCVYGTCVDLANGYTCECTPGYQGDMCDSEIDECLSDPCVHGQCIDQINGFQCNCKQGYFGLICDSEVDECDPNPCQNGGTCLDKLNGYQCKCTMGFTGTNCSNINPDLCGQVNLNSSCYDLDSDTTTICFEVQAVSDPSCQYNQFSFRSNCTAPSSSSPSGSFFSVSGISGFYWMTSGTPGSTEVYCVDYPGVVSIAEGMASIHFLGGAYHSTVLTPACENDNCQQDNACLNGGTCVDLFTGHFCDCPPGQFGSKCQFSF